VKSVSVEVHLIDTCALVNIRDIYNDSELIWSAVRKQISEGRLKTVRQVYEELARRFQPVHARLKDLRRVFLVPDGDLYGADVIAEVRAIHQHHPKLYDLLGGGNPADAILIAAAKALGAIVVTDEKTDGHGHRSRIPFVCTSRNVGCTKLQIISEVNRYRCLRRHQSTNRNGNVSSKPPASWGAMRRKPRLMRS
jgi:hypothetical protein